jgi:hypothetical protein
MTNRHVPLITGIVAIGLAIWIAFGFSGWWKYVVAGFLLAFGWTALKTGLFASDKEIRGLTEPGPISEETKRRFQDRL